MTGIHICVNMSSSLECPIWGLVTPTAPAIYPDRGCYTPTTRMSQSCPWVSTTDALFSQREMGVVVTISY
ncbi:hypothetical protein J6590_030677 [Homalodisca vitripennis]|nr:hypothetical protein J6590_030677 [Homalodisca vitripennis]